MKCNHPDSKMFSACTQCGGLVVPKAEMNYFEFFDLEPVYSIDQDRLQKEFYRISRSLHPDRFHTSSPENLMLATQWFAKINKALTTLKDTEDRIEYLFSLASYQPETSSGKLPPELAEDYFTLQEVLEEDGLPKEERRQKISDFASQINIQLKDAETKMTKAMKEWEAIGATLGDKALPYFKRASAEIRQRAYLKSMAQDLERRCQT